VLKNPLIVLNGGCLKVQPFQGVFKTNKLDLAQIASDLRANKPLSLTGSYVRPDATFTVTCSVDPKTISFLLPLLTQKPPITVDVAAARAALAIKCATADGKHQFGIDGDDIAGIDVDGNVVKVGGRTIDLGKVAPTILGGKTIEFNGFKLTGNQLTTPSGRVITLSAEDVIEFLSKKVLIVQGGKAIVFDENNNAKPIGEQCSGAARNGDKVELSCSSGKHVVDEQGNLLPDAPLDTTAAPVAKGSAASLLLSAAAAALALVSLAF